MRKFLFAAAAALLIAGPAAAETVAIVNARIETVGKAGSIPSGTLVIKDGRIAAVGADVKVPEGARIVDAQGGVVTPGLISPSTNLTVTEVDLIKETRDDGSGTQLSAGFDISYGINPASALIPLARQGGVTRVVVTPTLTGGGDGEDQEEGGSADAGLLQGGGGGGKGDPRLFAGQAAIVSLDASDTDPLVKARVAVALDLGQAGAANAGGSRGASLVLVRAALQDARDFNNNRAAYDRGATRDFGLSRVDLEALVPVVQGRIPLLIRVHRASDIRQALKLASDEKIKIIIEGAEEGWLVAADLAAAGVPVIIDTEADLPDQFETLGSRLDNAARLQAAGVLVVIAGSRDFNNLRQARFNAGMSVPYGMTWQQALAAVTLNPAKAWGMADRVGSLEVGKEADVVIWSGDPLDTQSWPTAVFIGGTQQPMTSRAQQLRDRYAKPDNGYPVQYR
ncbi:imidazolonepropionase-like amidohydrolase [Caulobacter ginsengisoli]|uniref:Imidazolonepropionase-like amidohydrolase n=1 Tax=Caulobacter ginsengisoli TaxID=400775 RepID=A0ABU0ILN2_9CAUL|nr:amidohydrolase family protein [Caulobacter ginsengisoli]MDQ0462920.1 imidazolonepropionase-like amidohydrolase [Caulobacter ginsengisoli]